MTEPDAPKPVEETPTETSVPTIRLDQFLQACGVPTGGQAKRLIQGGEVLLNGVVETRRKKKLTVGDEIGFDGEIFEVALGPAEDAEEEVSEDEAAEVSDEDGSEGESGDVPNGETE